MGLIKLECLPDNRNLLRFHGILVYIYIYIHFSKYITLIITIEDAVEVDQYRIGREDRKQREKGRGGTRKNGDREMAFFVFLVLQS